MQIHNNHFRIAQSQKQIPTKKGKGQEWIIYDVYQEGQERKPLDGVVTNSIRTNKDHLILFNYQQQFVTYLVNLNQYRFTEIANKSDWQDSQYSLYYFNRNSQVCLVQKNKALQRTRITFYNFIIQQDNIVLEQTSRKELEEDIHKQERQIFEINNEGKIGWFQNKQGKLEIALYHKDEGVKKYNLNLSELHQIFSQAQFKVYDMWQNDNLLFLIMNPAQDTSSLSSDHPFSPILIANLEKEGECPVSFSSCLLDEKYHLSIRNCINLQDYCILLTNEEKATEMPYYVYNKELQLIVLQNTYNPSHQVSKVYKHNTIVFYELIQDTLSCHERQFYRLHSLSFQKTLQLLQNAQSSKDTVKKAIIIFGGDKTGKSTLRHFLSGGKMIHSMNQEQGFSQVVAQDAELKGVEHDEQREKIAWMNLTEEAAIIDVPDWNDRDSSFKVGLSILLSRLFRIYNEFHFIVTIPLEYLEDSYKNQEFFRNLLQLVSKQEGIEQYITIFLTKVEQSLSGFNQKIQQITEINQETGNLIRKISEQNRILPFGNRQFDQNQGKQQLSDILSFKFLSFIQRNILSVQIQLQQPSEQIDLILSESQYSIRTFNTYLLSISHFINPNSFGYVQNIIQSHINHNYKKEGFKHKEIKNKEGVALAFIFVLARLRSILLKLDRHDQGVISQLKEALLNLDQVLQESDYHFKQAVLSFISVMRNVFLLPLENTIGKKIHPLADFKKILINQPDAVFGKNIKTVVKYLQDFESVRSSEEIKEFSSFISSSKPKIKKIIKVEMTYDQQKRQFTLKKGDMLQKICSLPSNALKLDLILQQLIEFTAKASLQAKDYKHINFYLRQASKICQYHNLYYEAIILLVVIPDFNGLEILIDQFVQFLKKNNSYQNKKLLNIIETQLVEKLLTICRECVRDNLAKKLINLNLLSLQTFSKPAASRKKEQDDVKNYLSNSESIKRYKQRLQASDINIFYNLKDPDFQKMLLQKNQIIKKCQEYENNEATRKRYEDKQALRYVLDVVPLPKS